MGSLPVDQILCGNAFDLLPSFPDESVDMVMFSPPYWGLRDYKLPPVVLGGRPRCRHEWKSQGTKTCSGGTSPGYVGQFRDARTHFKAALGDSCFRCGAWRGSFGLEPHPQMYVNHMALLCGLLKRVLKKSGSLWLNMGDTYFGGGRDQDFSNSPKQASNRGSASYARIPQAKSDGSNWLQPKQKLLIPERCAIALQEGSPNLLSKTQQTEYYRLQHEKSKLALEIEECEDHVEGKGWVIVDKPRYDSLMDSLQPIQKQLQPLIEKCGGGWVLRSDIIWHKPNHMPSSVKDRFTISWEHLYFFVKSRRYFFDLDAIRQPHTSLKDLGRKRHDTRTPKHDLAPELNPGGYLVQHPLGKCPDDTITAYEGKFRGFAEESEKFGSPRARSERRAKHGQNNPHRMRDDRERHVALNPARPNDLSHPMGKNPGDVLKLNSTACSAGPQRWEREGTNRIEARFNEQGKNPSDFWNINTRPFKGAHFAVYPERLCENPIKAGCPMNGIVLDPMCGSGTTLVVARKLLRHYVGIDLKLEYVEMALERLAQIATGVS